MIALLPLAVFGSGSFMSPGVFFLLLIGVLIFSFYAQIRVSSAYNRNAQIASRGKITGREAAEAVMAHAGINDVEIVETPGHLTDHYDPVNKRLVLSEENYRGTNLAALGVAAHEAGHAIQHKVGYAMLHFRMALVPATNFVSRVLPVVMLLGFFGFMGLRSGMILDLVIICYAVLTLFQLVTLPVEFDASRRAKAQLVDLGILDRDEMPGVNQRSMRRRSPTWLRSSRRCSTCCISSRRGETRVSARANRPAPRRPCQAAAGA